MTIKRRPNKAHNLESEESAEKSKLGITGVGGSIETPLPSIGVGSFGSKERGECIVTEEGDSVGGVVVMAGNAGFAERGNEAPVELG